MLHKPRILEDELVADGKYIQFIRRHFEDKKKRGVWEMVKRKTYGPVVSVAAITPKNELVINRAYRISLKRYIIELPAGIMDKKGEPAIKTARRELLEETGYDVKTLKKFVVSPANSGLLGENIVVYLGTGAFWKQPQRPEDSEYLEVLKIPLRDFPKFARTLPAHTTLDMKIPLVYFLLSPQGKKLFPQGMVT